MSIKEQLQNTLEGGKPIVDQELMALERFAEDTRHMIVFDVLTWNCPAGDKAERVRIFLTDEGYTKDHVRSCLKHHSYVTRAKNVVLIVRFKSGYTSQKMHKPNMKPCCTRRERASL